MINLSINQFAKCCGVNRWMVTKWIKDGEIKAVKAPGQKDYLISLDNLKKVKIGKGKRVRSPFETPKKNQSKVLIVDDEQSIIDSIAPIFSNGGFQILSSTNAFEAIFLMHAEEPLVLTLDLRMLDSCGGVDVLKMINDLDLNQNVWVIIISAANESELRFAVDFGADFYLQKPFCENDLNKIIKKISLGMTKKIA